MAKVFIICGHGDGDSGAVGNGYQEEERVRALAKIMKEKGGENVILGDINRNWYKEDLITKTDIPKDSKILELHMDAYGNPEAKGGHVIIMEGLQPDQWDKNIASLMEEIFPGRAVLINPRNLGNARRAEAKRYNYRLLECGFITNKRDIEFFNSNIEMIAERLLKCFDIEPAKNNKLDYEAIGKATVDFYNNTLKGLLNV